MAEQYPRGLCCHEAGHAIVAYSFNLHVESVCVRFEEAKGWYGCAKTSSPEYLSISDQVVNSAAGKAAEDRLTKGRGFTTSGKSPRYSTAADYQMTSFGRGQAKA
jgi:hypothetical protein